MPKGAQADTNKLRGRKRTVRQPNRQLPKGTNLESHTRRDQIAPCLITKTWLCLPRKASVPDVISGVLASARALHSTAEVCPTEDYSDA